MINVCLMAVGKNTAWALIKRAYFTGVCLWNWPVLNTRRSIVRPFQRSSNLSVLFRDLFPTTIIMGWYGWICLGSANKTQWFLCANVGVFYTPVQACGVCADRQWCFYRMTHKLIAEISLLKVEFKSLSSLNYRFGCMIGWRGLFIGETWITC